MKVFVGRQPIFNIKEELFGYELLYRSNQKDNIFPKVDGDQATAELIINSFLNIGIDNLCNGKPCFINFTENLLKLRLPSYFRPREIVVEILESVKPSPHLIDICSELKQLGYKIALDDFIFNESNQYTMRLLKYIDIIKVDFLNTPAEMRKKIEAIAKELGIFLLAEKVETRENLEEAKKGGYHYLQGYFFAKPVIVSTHDVPSYFISYYEMIQNLSVTEPNITRITELIERDISLSYKLLKLINSPAYRPKQKIHSIRQAVIYLGLIELKKWIYVLAVRESIMGKNDSSEEIIRISLSRAKTCEEIVKHQNYQGSSSSYFITGMFSMVDSLLGMPMEMILQELPFEEDICEALLGKHNELKKVLDLVLAVEKAEWNSVSQKCKELNFDEKILLTKYSESIFWTNEIVSREQLI